MDVWLLVVAVWLIQGKGRASHRCWPSWSAADPLSKTTVNPVKKSVQSKMKVWLAPPFFSSNTVSAPRAARARKKIQPFENDCLHPPGKLNSHKTTRPGAGEGRKPLWN
jgi:hypothetical protein